MNKENLYLLSALREIQGLKGLLEENGTIPPACRLGVLNFLGKGDRLFPFENKLLDPLLNLLRESLIRRGVIPKQNQEDLVFFRLLCLTLVAFSGYLIDPYSKDKEKGTPFNKDLYPYLFLSLLSQAKFLDLFLEKLLLLSNIKEEKGLLESLLLLFYTLSIGSLEVLKKGLSTNSFVLLRPSFLKGLSGLKELLSLNVALLPEEIQEREEQGVGVPNFKHKEKQLIVFIESLIPLFEEDRFQDPTLFIESLFSPCSFFLSQFGENPALFFEDIRNLISFSKLVKESCVIKREEISMITPI